MINLNESSDNASSTTCGSLFTRHRSLHILLGRAVWRGSARRDLPYSCVWRGVCLPRELTAAITQASEQTHLQPPNAVVPRGRGGVQGRDVVVQRKVRFCCFFAGNRLARESGGTCVRWMALTGGGAVTCWRGCASPTPLMIGPHLMAPKLHERHSCSDTRKLTSSAAKITLLVAFLDSLPLNALIITGFESYRRRLQQLITSSTKLQRCQSI